MLLKTAAAPPPTISTHGRRSIIIPFGKIGGMNKSSSERSRASAFAGLVVRAGYTRRQMDTPGAYQLIDDETGEKFIVWGGPDNDDNNSQSPPPPPPEQVLRWKPHAPGDTDTHKHNRNHAAASVTSETNRALSSFGRLRAHRVRDIHRIASSTKQRNNDHAYDVHVLTDKSLCLPIAHELMVKQKRLKAVKDRPSFVSGLAISQKVVREMEGRREDKFKPDLSINDGLTNIQDPYSSVSESRDSDSLLKDSDSGMFIHKSGSTQINISENLRKSNADRDFFSRKSFRDLGCTDYLLGFLRSQLLVRPSHIQAMSFAHVIKGKSCIIADQSGSGKTLAYLLPVIQRLREEELQGLGKSFPQNPRVIILVPTAELASQVLRNCRLLSKFGAPFRSMIATGGFRQKTQLENLQQDLDILIVTPGRFMFLVEEGFLQLANLKCAILDEVDILFKDEDFQLAFRVLMHSSPVITQYLFVTATLPLNIYNELVEKFPDSELVMGPGMHRTSSGLEEILVDCSGESGTEKTPDTAFVNKKSALLQLVKESPVTKTIIFCNKIETCRKVENALNRFNREGVLSRVLPFHAALAQESRIANMEEFCHSQLKHHSLFLVCTDRASRGIDFAGVDQVVLFDFPRDPSEYVRRVGRTARGAGGKGKAFIFVVGKQVSLAQKIIERNRKGHPLHDVPSTY